ncbi:MAG: MarR family transcriptional regulator [Candidatus Omnitrophica bacterium]|nr:MarR family transcriptional regulator [Candidatus Omnitrophota bacterium]
MAQIPLSEFVDELNRIMPEIMRGFMRRQENELLKGKITLPQFLILDFLNKRVESRMTELAHFLEVSTPCATNMVDRLVRQGYLLRIYDPKDRRIIKIRLSSKGACLVEKINQQRKQKTTEVFAKLSSYERSVYLKILRRIKEIVTEKE